MSPEIYLDTNATTPVLPQALAAACRTMQEAYGNPSSSHSTGLVAQDLRESVRRKAASLLGAGAGRLLFVSGATEGIQTAVLSGLCALRERRAAGDTRARLLVYGATEHKAVPESLAYWNRVLGLDLEIRALPVDTQGLHDLTLLAQWAGETGMLCTMAANNETGVVSDIAGIEQVLARTGSPTLWLVDCVQALGKLPLNLQATRIDYAPFSGHKLYAPKGIGMLYVRAGSPFHPLMVGGGQEGGARSGTENMPGIAALGAVLDALARGDTFCSTAILTGYRDQLVQAIRDAFPQVVFNAPLAQTLPTTLNFSAPGLSSRMLLDLFDAAGVRISSGSACSAAKAEPSFVLQAMGLPEWQTTSAIRLSFGALADQSFIDSACAAIRKCGAVLRASAQAAQTCKAAPVDVTAMGAGQDPTPALAWSELEQLLQDEPQTLLVDVREAYEYAATAPLRSAGRTAQNLPLSELERAVPGWLAQHRHPVVFFCRSGNRSLQALRALQRQGHLHGRHLAGGLALGPSPH
ncbi:MAG: aminotransferase class V-fold PLP-dependent enzyme [Rhodoferax sp.]|nr:aminotransferase class V-fold PLP-dependent enzyme [Rhodoferax sp.]